MTDSQTMDCKNLQEEVERIKSSDLFTPNDVLDSIKMNEPVKVIGFIDKMDPPRIVGDQQQYNVFQFSLNNDNGKRVQVISWNDEIKRVLPHVKLNHIIQLDNIQARPPKNPSYNNGNVNYELVIRPNTIIKNMGIHVPKNTLNEPTLTELTDIANTTDHVSPTNAVSASSQGHAISFVHRSEEAKEIARKMSQDSSQQLWQQQQQQILQMQQQLQQLQQSREGPRNQPQDQPQDQPREEPRGQAFIFNFFNQKK